MAFTRVLLDLAPRSYRLLAQKLKLTRSQLLYIYYHSSDTTGTCSILPPFFLSCTLKPPTRTSASNSRLHFPLFKSINNELPFGSANLHFSDSNWNPASFLITQVLPLLPNHRNHHHHQVSPHSLNHLQQWHSKMASMRLPVYQIKQVCQWLVVSRNRGKH